MRIAFFFIDASQCGICLWAVSSANFLEQCGQETLSSYCSGAGWYYYPPFPPPPPPLLDPPPIALMAALNYSDYAFHFGRPPLPPLIGCSSLLAGAAWFAFFPVPPSSLFLVIRIYLCSFEIILFCWLLNSFLFYWNTLLQILTCFSYASSLNFLSQSGHWFKSISDDFGPKASWSNFPPPPLFFNAGKTYESISFS